MSENKYINAVQNWIARTLMWIRNIPFTLRLNYLVWKYGDGSKIPPHELPKIEVSETEERIFSLMSACMELCGGFHLNWRETNTFTTIGRVMTGHADQDEYDVIEKAIEKKSGMYLSAFALLKAHEDLPGVDLITARAVAVRMDTIEAEKAAERIAT